MALPLTADAPPLTTDADGIVRVGGTRVTLETVVDTFREGLTAEEIQQYPALDLPRVYSAIAYYLPHRPEVDEYLRERAAARQSVRREVEARSDPTGARGGLDGEWEGQVLYLPLRTNA